MMPFEANISSRQIENSLPEKLLSLPPASGTIKALEQSGQVILGLVYDPLHRECFRAVRGQGATLNGDRLRTSVVQELDKALLATGFPYDRREKADFYLTFFKAFMTRCQGIRRNGSAAPDLCYVACGRLDGFCELKLQPWDVAAGERLRSRLAGIHARSWSCRPNGSTIQRC